MDNSGNLLISGATMVLPKVTKVGDLRITNGIITEIGDAGTLENHDDEMFVDGKGLHLLLVVLTHKCTFETLDSQNEKIWEVAPLLV